MPSDNPALSWNPRTLRAERLKQAREQRAVQPPSIAKRKTSIERSYKLHRDPPIALTLPSNESLTSRLNRLRPTLITLYTQAPRLRYIEIAERVGLRVDEVSPLLLALIHEGAIPRRKGTRRTMALTEQQTQRMLRIRTLRQQGHSWSRISELMGITRQGVHQFYRDHAHQLSACIDAEAC